MLHEDRKRAESFGADAWQYDRSRPSYPPALVDALAAHAPANTLDVGCGTGIASRLFAARGIDVLGVEIDERMAVVAREHGMTVEIGQFESWNAAGRQFDLVFSGQAWHWIDPVVGPERVAQILRSGARFGMFWNWARHDPEIKAALTAVYTRCAPGLDMYAIVLGNGRVDRLHDAATTFRKHGAFDDVRVSTFEWATSYTRDEWLDQLHTHSDRRALDDTTRAELLDGIGAVIDAHDGTLPMTYQTWLVSGSRR